ncbi:sugar-binding transcriptional regulator [Herbaspirillum seropedicae]|uniref:sugar-binding transcriptional regulator n=1 Tax=Herbaspirillum seropedicae TaxID=964 RepID=UPI001123D703|nr:sugar-binding transcriptional regulator [Herbaspirillum seropedicae]QDD63586.1 sugar-binding transcriptional regulator [Herbaspirillum seropedicae]
MSMDELTRLATLYYVDGLTQQELSERFSISRASIARMLKRAQDEGIVEIRVRHHPGQTIELEHALMQRFGIERALISVSHNDQDRQRAMLAGLVANHLDRSLTDDSIVAVGVGRNINAVSEHAVSNTRRSATFVCAIGGYYRGGEAMNSDHICRRLASRFGGDSETLYAPALVDNALVRDALLTNDAVRPTLDKARRADVALIGVGDIHEDSPMVRMGWFSPQEIQELKRHGAVGDMMGYDFINIHGEPIRTETHARVIGLTVDDLRRIPDVIAVASESGKASAMLGALRTGAIKTLATTDSIAHTLLTLEEATRKSAA